MKRSLIVFYVLIFVVSASMPAYAGKGGSGSGSSIQLAPLAQTLNESAWPRFGDQVTFLASTTRTEYPWVQNRCWQNGTLVLEQWHGFFDGYYTDPVFTLASHVWTGGTADCTARLVDWGRSGKERTLATTAFAVSG